MVTRVSGRSIGAPTTSCRARRLVGQRVRDLEQLARDARLFVEGLRRDNSSSNRRRPPSLQPLDRIAVVGRRELLVARMDEQRLGVLEVDDTDLLNIPSDTLDIVVTAADVDGRTLADLAGEDFARSVFIERIARAGTPIPVSPARRSTEATW